MKYLVKFIVNNTVFLLYTWMSRLFLRVHPSGQGLLAPRNWKPFLASNCESLEESLLILKRNLDSESKTAINNYVKRVIFTVLANQSETYIAPAAWYKLLSNEEKEDIKKIPQRSKDFAGSEYIEINDNGLKFVPDDVLRKLEGTDFIDGGAYIGDSIRVLVKHKPGRIYAFEPNSANIQKLLKNAEKYNWKGIVPVNKGLGESKTTEHIIFAADRSIIDKNGTGSIEITDIDSFVGENGINLGVIKLDVEGLESAIIRGAAESIKKYKPVLLISIYHTPEDFLNIKPFIENLNLDYTFLVRKLAPNRAFGEVMLIGFCK